MPHTRQGCCSDFHIAAFGRSDEDKDVSGEDVMKLRATEKVEMKFGDCNAPYKRTRVGNSSLQGFCCEIAWDW